MAGDLEPCLGPLRGLAGGERQLEEVLGARSGAGGQGEGDGDALGGQGCDVELGAGQLPALHRPAVGDDRPAAVEFAEVGEQVLVGDGEAARGAPTGRRDIDRLEDTLDLRGLAGVPAVRHDDAVGAETAVVRVVPEVTAVGAERGLRGPDLLDADGGGVEPEPHPLVAGSAGAGREFGPGQGAGVDARPPDGAAELAGRVVRVGGEGDRRVVAVGALRSGLGGLGLAVDVEGQGGRRSVEDTRDVVLGAGPVLREGPARGGPPAGGVDEELQVAVRLLQCVLGVALGQNGLMPTGHLLRDPRLQGQ